MSEKSKYDYINEFLERSKDGYISTLELHSRIKDITNNFEPEQIKLLKGDVFNKIDELNDFIEIYSIGIEYPDKDEQIVSSNLSIHFLKTTIFYLDVLLESPNKPNEAVPKLNWNGTQTELIELLKAIVESKKIDGTQTEIIKAFSLFLGVEIKNPSKLINDIKLRNWESRTLFLDNLKSNLTQFLDK